MPRRRLPALATSIVVTCALALAVAPAAGAVAGAAPAGDAVDGVVTTVVADDFEGGRSVEHRAVRTSDGSLVPLGTDLRSASAAEGTSVRALVNGSSARVVETLAPDASAGEGTLGDAAAVAEKLYVVAVDDPSTGGDFTTDGATAIAQSAADYWTRQSRRAISTFAVAGSATLTLDHSCTSDFGTLATAARALFGGVSFGAAGTHLVVFSPTGCDYGYAGLANIGSGFAASGSVHVVGSDWGILAHELGHNFGLGHANLRFAEPGTGDGGAHSYWGAYGPQQLQINDFDPGALDAAYRSLLAEPGEAARRRTIAWDALPATYRLVPVTSATGVSSLVIQDPVSGTPIYLDYRSGAGDDAYTFYSSTFGPVKFDEGEVAYDAGVHVTSLRGRDLDTLPFAYGGGDFGATGATGDTLALHGGQLTVRVGALTAAGADVTVSFSARPQVRTTAKIAVPSVTERSKAKISVALSGSTTPTGAAAIYQDGTKIGTVTLVHGKATLVTPHALTRGTHAFVVRYAGSLAFAAARASTKSVVKDASTVHATVAKVTAGTSAKLKVRISSTLKATGVVKVYRGSTYVGKATLKDRRATFHLPKTWKAKTYTLKVVYAGTAKIAGSRTSVKLVIKPR